MAVVRDPTSSKAAPLGDLPGVTLAEGNMSDPAKLKDTLSGANAVFLVTPGSVNRTILTIAAMDAAKEAGVPFIVTVSVSTADPATKDTLFGGQLIPVEKHAERLGVDYTILRLPIFLDNWYGVAGSVKGEGKMYGPVRPEAPWTPVAVADVGECAAKILTEGPSRHGGKTYRLHSKTHTHRGAAEAIGRALGKQVEYVQVPFEAAREAFMGAMPEWQVDGVLQLYRLFEAESAVTNDPTDDIENILGRPPMTVAEWIEQARPAFE